MEQVKNIIDPHNPLVRGIKAVGIGKKGSKSLEPSLIDEIIDVLKNNPVPDIQKGAFFGALVNKGITAQELKLEETLTPGALKDNRILADLICHDAPKQIKELCIRLLNREELDLTASRELGVFLFSQEAGEGARGLSASILRVRYETQDEYQGILENIEKSFLPPFIGDVQEGDPIIQIAEPFDGVDHSNLITPLVADKLQKQNYRVISLMGRNSGPKYGNNLFDIAYNLNATIVKSNSEIGADKPPFGYYIDQKDLSSAMDQWVDRRQLTIKRPFMATLERFVNPTKAKVIVASAFHPQYGEKMISICERAGFPASIIVRNGIEGSLGFALKRKTIILASALNKEGAYIREEFGLDPKEDLDIKLKVEEKLTNPSLEKNIELIQEFAKKGCTDYPLFDLRIKVTCLGLQNALKWIEAERNK